MADSALSYYLKIFRRRLRLQDGVREAQRNLWIAMLISLAIQGIGRVFPVEMLTLWTLTPIALWLLSMSLYTALKPLPSMRVARRVDQALGLRQRLSTALIFENISASHYKTALYANPRLVTAQRADALSVAIAIRPSRDLPLTWQPRPLWLAGALFACVVVSAILPNPMDAVLAQRRQLQEEAARQAQKIEKIREEIAQSRELSLQTQEELLRQLAELAEKLRRNPGDLERALADLSNLEKSLQAQQDSNAASQQANLESLAQRLSTLAQRPLEAQDSAAQAAAQALADIAANLPSLEETERRELAHELAQMAAATAQSGDADLAQALSALAQAVQSGDPQTAAQAAQSAQTALADAEVRLNDQAALQNAIAQLQDSRQALAQSARQAASGQSAAQALGQGPGQSPGQTAGSNPGSQGAPQGGGGSRANTLPPATGGRGNVRPQGAAPNVAPAPLSQQVYAPWQRTPGSSDQLFIPGQDTGQGQTQVKPGQSNLPGADNPALVPYDQVFYDYFNLASQTIQQSHIPSALLSYVKNYFSLLSPSP